MSLADLSGRSVKLAEPDPGRKQLLFAFTHTCEYCRESYSIVAALGEKLTTDTSRHIDLIGVVLDQGTRELSAFLAAAKPSYPVVVLPARWQPLFRFTTVPALVLVDSFGTVLFSHVGTLRSDGAIDSLHHYLGWPPERSQRLGASFEFK